MEKYNSDMKLKFDARSHTYWYGKHEMMSVTRFVGMHFPKFYTDKVAKKLERYNKIGKTAEQFKKEWKQRADHGTEVHQALEDYEIQGDDFNLKAFKGEAAAKIEQGMNFMKLNFRFGKYNSYIVNPEMRVGSFNMGLAGTIDVPAFGNGKCVVIDWKTNKKLTSIGYGGSTGTHPLTKHLPDCHMIKYGLQLSVYAHILEEEYGYKVEKLILVHLRNDRYVEYPVQYMKELVIKMIEAKNDESKRINI